MFDWIQWSNPVAVWWIFLVTSSVFNICAWFWLRYFRFTDTPVSSAFRFRTEPRSIIWLGAAYVFVCAFRSILPRADVQRICLFDTWFSCVFLGRSLATVAELAFVAQWSVILGVVGKALNDRWIQKTSTIILFTILTAEIFSWYAVISTHYLGNSVEESLWGLTYIGISVAIFRLWLKVKGPMRLTAGFAFVGCLLYVTFMYTVDVPMYVSRLLADTASGQNYFGFQAGISDLLSRWVVTHDIQDWKTEIPWMTLYFTLAVSVSLGLCLLPLNVEDWKKHLQS